ncbi:hypothetical protein CLV51_10116 [Chitinophaga niastensis]|uniref:Addiction module component n=1 Tax=Chitinophaga niastensis TaxID=536980 RepID=A0A2P8HR78_CHINA|nr:addiction module protein [Chitinophaga niastensis]PSL48692.1 hypothetical protein CLV51_10116 [Chitinophaga niastensis]
MKTATIRQKLYEYIRVADDKKVKAIFTLVEDEANEIINWWEHVDVINELEKRSADLKSGKDKGISWGKTKKKILVSK